MLSVLIPIYNYNANPLVCEIQKQAQATKIEFEIICFDDSSLLFKSENRSIALLPNCIFEELPQNIGRSKIINLLAKEAKFEWLLILDCDTYPKNSNFISNYITTIQKNDYQAVFGGIVYKTKKPEKDKLLRWVYGNKRESLSLEKRIKNPIKSALTSNFLIKRELFARNPFNEAITKYGYEDLCFLMDLETKKIQIYHIDNPTFHLNLETSLLFLNKTKIALENLVFIVDSNISKTINSKIVSTHSLLKKLGLTKIAAMLFKVFENKISNNLLSEKPSLLLFDLYKLGYFCKISSKN